MNDLLIAHNGARIFGGCERWTARTLQGLQQRGRRVLLLCNHEIVAEQSARYGIPVDIQKLGGDIAFPDVFTFASRLRREDPAVVLFTTFKKIWLGFMAARLADVPHTVVRIGLSTDVARNIKYHIALRRIDTIVVNAPDMAASFGGRALTIPNGVPMPEVTVGAAAFRQALGVPADAFVIGTVARPSHQKRLDRIIDALTQLPDAYAIIAGDGPEREAIHELARERGVIDRVRLLGHREDAGDVINALDVYVITSDSEGLSNAMLEAMAMGKPVVSTPVSGAAFALSDAGIVLPDFTVDSITRELSQLQQSPQLRQQLGAAARTRFEERFQFERMLDAWEHVLFPQHTTKK